MVLNNPVLLEVGRLAVEDKLVDYRDSRISVLRNNGLCIREYDGRESSVVRMSIEEAVTVAMRAIIEELSYENSI